MLSIDSMVISLIIYPRTPRLTVQPGDDHVPVSSFLLALAEGDQIPVSRVGDEPIALGQLHGCGHPEDVRTGLQRADVEVMAGRARRSLVDGDGWGERERRRWHRDRWNANARGDPGTLEPEQDASKVRVVARVEPVDMVKQFVAAGCTRRCHLGNVKRAHAASRE